MGGDQKLRLRQEAANRLADVSHHTLLSTSFATPVDASVNASTSKAFDDNSEKIMDCCGRATVALGLEKLCLLLHGSALKARLEALHSTPILQSLQKSRESFMGK